MSIHRSYTRCCSALWVWALLIPTMVLDTTACWQIAVLSNPLRHRLPSDSCAIKLMCSDSLQNYCHDIAVYLTEKEKKKKTDPRRRVFMLMLALVPLEAKLRVQCALTSWNRNRSCVAKHLEDFRSSHQHCSWSITQNWNSMIHLWYTISHICYWYNVGSAISSACASVYKPLIWWIVVIIKPNGEVKVSPSLVALPPQFLSPPVGHCRDSYSSPPALLL